LLEIQIEGKNGWAKELPTWRIYPKNTPKIISSLFAKDRPLTGYHTYLFSFIFLIAHFWILTTKWNFKTELLTLAFFAGFTTIEDFLWFVLNPNFGISKFNSKHIPWHSTWFLYLPVSYYPVIILTFLLYFFSL
jgi:hypothetical protein